MKGGESCSFTALHSKSINELRKAQALFKQSDKFVRKQINLAAFEVQSPPSDGHVTQQWNQSLGILRFGVCHRWMVVGHTCVHCLRMCGLVGAGPGARCWVRVVLVMVSEGFAYTE